MTPFFLTIAVSALAGGACGYLLARHVWQDRLLDMEENRQELRRKRLELHREQFQQSTSRIHRPTAADSEAPVQASEEMEQLRLEMTLLQEDHRVEKELLQREIEELKSDSPSLSGMHETEAVIIEADYSDEIEETDTIEDPAEHVIIAEVDVVAEEGEPAEDEDVVAEEVVLTEKEDVVAEEGELTEEMAITVPETQDTPESTTPPNATSVLETFFVLDESDVQPESEAPTAGGNPEPQDPPTHDKRKEPRSSIAPVPTDIESLFRAPRVEEPEVRPSRTQEVERETESAEARTEAPAKEPSLDPDADMLAEEPNAEARTEEPGEEAHTDDSTPAETDATPFAIHWNADRPGRHKDLSVHEETAEFANSALDSSENEGGPEPAIPVFRSLHDMLAASGVSPAVHDSTSELSEQASPLWSPQSAHTASLQGGPSTDKALIRSIVSLDAESFSLLDELGYASLIRLAQLSPSEIRRLAQVFRINPDQIEQDWKPTATAHLNMQSSGRS